MYMYVMRRLIKAGRPARRTIKKPLLNCRIRKQRLVWAKQYQHMTLED